LNYKNNGKKIGEEASALKSKQLKEEKEREAGNQEPLIDTDTEHDAQNNEEELVAAKEPQPKVSRNQENEMEPVLDQGPADEEEPITEEEKESANEDPPVKAKPFNLPSG
jgi:hypothetical protein